MFLGNDLIKITPTWLWSLVKKDENIATIYNERNYVYNCYINWNEKDYQNIPKGDGERKVRTKCFCFIHKKYQILAKKFSSSSPFHYLWWRWLFTFMWVNSLFHWKAIRHFKWPFHVSFCIHKRFDVTVYCLTVMIKRVNTNRNVRPMQKCFCTYFGAFMNMARKIKMITYYNAI